MNPWTLLLFVSGYFAVLLGMAWYTSRGSNNDSFFNGNKNSNWMLVAFGMIGTSLSGVTFVSVPGGVGNFGSNGFTGFDYMQVSIGYLIGYFIVAFLLLPLYYRLNLTSIYDYLLQRFGTIAYKTGAMFFIISRTVGATARLYLVINILQAFILDKMGIPFVVTAAIILLMILLYTFEGGVKTIVYTDTLQTTLMITGLIVCIAYIVNHLNLSIGGALGQMKEHNYLNVFDTDVKSTGFFGKQILGGAFITIAMTGLDQEMMQKNISVKRLGDSQKNMITMSIVMTLVVLLFLVLGGLLYLYTLSQGAVYQGKGLLLNGSNVIGDKLFPTVALNILPPAIGIVFIIALISALFPSADGALTALTSSFCIDILGMKRREDWSEEKKRSTRLAVHITMAIIFLLCIIFFKIMNDNSVIRLILTLAGYTYGPLLGLFSFGILTKRKISNSYIVTVIAFASPIICYILSVNAAKWFNGFHIGIELLIINGLITFLGLLAISKKAATTI